MYKIIGADRKEYGPVTADLINAWILEGRADGHTLAQAEGAGEWKPLASFPEFVSVLAAKYPAYPAPPPIGSTDPAVLAEAVLARNLDLKIGHCLGRGWRLLLNNLPLFLGASLLLVSVRLGLGLVPFIGPVAYFVLFGALYGGFYMMFLKRVRGEPGAIGDVFAGFSQNFVQLMLAGIVTKSLGFIGLLFCILPGVYLAVAWKFTLVLVADKRLEFWPAMELSRKVITRYWFHILGMTIVAYLPLILFVIYSGIHMFGIFFPIISRGGPIDFSQFTKFMGVALSFSLVQMLILVFVLPFACSSLMYAYEDIFGTRPAPAA